MINRFCKPVASLVAWVGLVTLGAFAADKPTLLSPGLTPDSCRPGYGIRLTYRWQAEPMDKDYTVFVHFISPDGKIGIQDDHTPEVPTSRWNGRVEYTRTIIAPTTAAEGAYKILVGLYDPKAAGHPALKAGPGVVELADGTTCQIGVLNVASNAPIPKLPPATLNLADYRLTFDEDFNAPLSVSAWGPGTRWIAHTPSATDFGDAQFADPETNFPFTVTNGILRIEAKKDGGHWRAGLLSSVDSKGQGFSQKFGYFEMRAKFPKGLGTWPAFWLLGVPQLVEPRDKKTITQIEIDVVEEYGVAPNAFATTVHLWGPNNFHWGKGEPFVAPGITDDFHTYGVMVEDDFTTFYFDGVEVRRDKTLKEAKVPLYLLVNLALGGGWPIDQTPNPSYLYVDYVRAYAKKQGN